MKKTSLAQLIAFLFILTLMPLQAFAKDASVTAGAMGGISSSEYKGISAVAMPFPLIKIDGERFYLNGLQAGVKLINYGNHRLTANVNYLPLFFDASESSKWYMKRLDDRHSTIMAGGTYSYLNRYTTDFSGVTSLSFSADILGVNKGMMGDLSHTVQAAITSNLGVSATLGAMWTNDKFNNYYYGVTRRESAKSGLKHYSPDDGFSPYLGVGSSLALGSWKLGLSARATFLSNEIKDSPMVNKDVKYTLGASIGYAF